jgi:hypothetical protein
VVGVAPWLVVSVTRHELDHLQCALGAADVRDLDIGFPRGHRRLGNRGSRLAWFCIVRIDALVVDREKVGILIRVHSHNGHSDKARSATGRQWPPVNAFFWALPSFLACERRSTSGFNRKGVDLKAGEVIVGRTLIWRTKGGAVGTFRRRRPLRVAERSQSRRQSFPNEMQLESSSHHSALF